MEAENIEKNWHKYESLCKRFSDPALDTLIDTLGERLAICPYSIKTEYAGCYPGGLVDISLRILTSMRKINETLDESDRLPIAKILKVGLLHDLSKVGDLEQDHFLEQDSGWHRDKLGQLYKYNENLPKMSYAHRTLFLLQSAGVSLERDEWEAILISGGMHLEENRFYSGTRSQLSRILLSAKMMTL